MEFLGFGKYEQQSLWAANERGIVLHTWNTRKTEFNAPNIELIIPFDNIGFSNFRDQKQILNALNLHEQFMHNKKINYVELQANTNQQYSRYVEFGIAAPMNPSVNELVLTLTSIKLIKNAWNWLSANRFWSKANIQIQTGYEIMIKI